MKKELGGLYWLLDLLVNLVVIYILVVLIQSFLIAPFDVSGASMCPTLNTINDECERGEGEKIIINVAKYVIGDPERGDIVVFQPDGHDKFFIKRIIGLPHETVKIENGEVFIKKANAQGFIQLDENYLNEENSGNTQLNFSDFNEFKVPEGQYFVMGDNRKDSTDSRSCFSGIISTKCTSESSEAYIPKQNIKGEAMVVWWPPKNIRLLKEHQYNELGIAR